MAAQHRASQGAAAVLGRRNPIAVVAPPRASPGEIRHAAMKKAVAKRDAARAQAKAAEKAMDDQREAEAMEALANERRIMRGKEAEAMYLVHGGSGASGASSPRTPRVSIQRSADGEVLSISPRWADPSARESHAAASQAASTAALEAEAARLEASAARAEAEATRAEAHAARARAQELLPEDARPLVYSLPPLGPSSRALVLGMGGGCDVFAAYSIAQLWGEQASCHESAVVLYGNAVSPVLDSMANNDHHSIHAWAQPRDSPHALLLASCGRLACHVPLL